MVRSVDSLSLSLFTPRSLAASDLPSLPYLDEAAGVRINKVHVIWIRKISTVVVVVVIKRKRILVKSKKRSLKKCLRRSKQSRSSIGPFFSSVRHVKRNVEVIKEEFARRWNDDVIVPNFVRKTKKSKRHPSLFVDDAVAAITSRNVLKRASLDRLSCTGRQITLVYFIFRQRSGDLDARAR